MVGKHKKQARRKEHLFFATDSEKTRSGVTAADAKAAGFGAGKK